MVKVKSVSKFERVEFKFNVKELKEKISEKLGIKNVGNIEIVDFKSLSFTCNVYFADEYKGIFEIPYNKVLRLFVPEIIDNNETTLFDSKIENGYITLIIDVEQK